MFEKLKTSLKLRKYKETHSGDLSKVELQEAFGYKFIGVMNVNYEKDSTRYIATKQTDDGLIVFSVLRTKTLWRFVPVQLIK